MDQVSQIKQKLDIVDIIGSYIPLKKAGRNYRAVCPFHAEKTPSFMVSPELQMYKCFGCGVSGDIFKFIEQIEGVDFPSALEQMAERAGIKLEKSSYDPDSYLKKQIYFINEITAKFYQYILLKHTLGKKGLDYLTKKRNLTLETIEEFKIGCAPDNWDSLYKFLSKKGFKSDELLKAGVIVPKQTGSGYIDKFRGRIIFPLTGVDGKIVGFTARTLFDREPKYLNTNETPVFHKSFFLFGLDKNKLNIKKEGALFVEGQMDLISSWQAGIRNVVSVSGTSLTANQLSILSRYTNEITFCFDSDSAGVSASYRAVELAERQNFNIKIAIIPEPFKDIDDLIKHNTDNAKKQIKEAIPAYDYFILTTLKKYDRNTSAGKKNIMDALIPLFSRISNKVLFDDYARRIAKELELSEETVFSVLKKGETDERDEEILYPEEKIKAFKQNPEGYFIALLFKSDPEVIRKYTQDIELESFQDRNLGEIYKYLIDYVSDRKKPVDINSFVKKMDEEKKKIVAELYLWDLDFSHDVPGKIDKEIEFTVKRIMNEALRRELKEISNRIKIAEMEGNSTEIQKLTKKFEKLSKGLL